MKAIRLSRLTFCWFGFRITIKERFFINFKIVDDSFDVAFSPGYIRFGVIANIVVFNRQISLLGLELAHHRILVCVLNCIIELYLRED